MVARPCRAGREAAGLEGFRPPFGLGRVTLERPALFKKCTKGLLPHLFARLRRVPSAHPLVRRHAPTGHWPSPSMASAKVRFEHPCSRAKSGRAALALFRFGPWPGAAHSTFCLAAWTSVLASANKMERLIPCLRQVETNPLVTGFGGTTSLIIEWFLAWNVSRLTTQRQIRFKRRWPHSTSLPVTPTCFIFLLSAFLAYLVPYPMLLQSKLRKLSPHPRLPKNGKF